MADSYDHLTLQQFASKFRQVAAEETRTIQVLERDDIPLGEYGFLEFFCADPDCDCRRVTLQVTTPDGRVWASISFGWENARFYRRWAHDSDDGDEMAGASLDPLNRQSKFAEWFLVFFREMVKTDRKYVERLKRHYQMFKDLPGKKSGAAARNTQVERARKAVLSFLGTTARTRRSPRR